MAPLTVGIGGVRRHACAALADPKGVLSVCEQERVTRVRGAGVNASGFPDEALELLLQRAGRSRSDVGQYTVACEPSAVIPPPSAAVEHHYAHACAAYLTSPFRNATIVVCDHEAPKVTVWRGKDREVSRVDWPWNGIGFSDLYTDCARVLGFDAPAGDQRFELLSRYVRSRAHAGLENLFSTDGHRLILTDGWESIVQDAANGRGRPTIDAAAGTAAAVEARIGEIFLEFLASVRGALDDEHLCLGGSFFYHSSINSLARTAGLYTGVFVPIDPGNAGLSVGSALHAVAAPPRRLSPFLGPAYEPDEIKATLDNCKLSYTWVDDGEAVSVAADALRHGRLVGWFEGGMEWGPRALGARSILANPFAPFVLENLNRFLKRREPWRGYALSALPTASPLFDGPGESPFMECDYSPRDPGAFRHILPSLEAGIRVQTVTAEAPGRFRMLLQAFGQAVGVPCLVNTSFNGFHEPIVCTPRDAIRVFYGSGLDVLLLDRFLLLK